MVNDAWKGRGFPKVWRDGVICQIFKNGDSKDKKLWGNHVAYKIYAMIEDCGGKIGKANE